MLFTLSLLHPSQKYIYFEHYLNHLGGFAICAIVITDWRLRFEKIIQ